MSYKITNKNQVHTCQEASSIIGLALVQAMDRGITRGPIHDVKTAIEYLNSIGITVEEEKK